MVQVTKAETFQEFVVDSTEREAQVYTDESRSYIGLYRKHDTVNHSVQEYVKDLAHTNWVGSFWAMVMRAYKDTYHKFSKKHLDQHIIEAAGCRNFRELDTLNQRS